MDRPIAVVDLTSGELLEREQETLTVDVPADLDPGTTALLVDANRLARYRTAAGATRVYLARPRMLWQRGTGEECLVASQEVEFNGAACVRRYSRSLVKPPR